MKIGRFQQDVPKKWKKPNKWLHMKTWHLTYIYHHFFIIINYNLLYFFLIHQGFINTLKKNSTHLNIERAKKNSK
jgi:hypothetical protein